MTSSLVGSEMCIRDSIDNNNNHLTIVWDKYTSLTKQLVDLVPTPAAVSYTHLTLPTICSV
eukprot:12336308-Prorocentrum_lima.AAC.1